MARNTIAEKPPKQKRPTSASDGEIVLLTWTDYVGIARCRGVPLAAFKVAVGLWPGLGGCGPGPDAL